MPSSDPSNLGSHDPNDPETELNHLPRSPADSLKHSPPSQIEIDLTISTSQMKGEQGNFTLPISVILLALISIVTIITAVSWYSNIMQDEDRPTPAPETPSQM